MTFLEIAHILGEMTKPMFALISNKSVSRSFQLRAIPPVVWNARDYVLHFTSRMAHFAASINIESDFLSGVELNVTEEIHLSVQEDIQTTSINVTTSSSDVNDKKVFFTQADNENGSKKQTLQQKEQSRQDVKQWVGNEEPSTLRNSLREHTKINRKTTLCSMNQIKANG